MNIWLFKRIAEGASVIDDCAKDGVEEFFTKIISSCIIDHFLQHSETRLDLNLNRMKTETEAVKIWDRWRHFEIC